MKIPGIERPSRRLWLWLACDSLSAEVLNEGGDLIRFLKMLWAIAHLFPAIKQR
jgi:hypothetical protein